MDKPPRIRVTQVVECDTTRLYGPMSLAIAYLEEVYSEYPDAQLDEHWYGYESMEMRFTFLRDETDAEYQARLDQIALVEKNRKRKAREDQTRKQKLTQYNKLKRELGL